MERRSRPRQGFESGLTPEAKALMGEIALQARTRDAPGIEKPTQAMFQALLKEDGEPITSLLNYVAEKTIVRRAIKPAAAVSAFRTALVYYFTNGYEEAGKVFSDANRNNVEDWAEPVAMLKEDLNSERTRT